jgi:hypothetical protein
MFYKLNGKAYNNSTQLLIIRTFKKIYFKAYKRHIMFTYYLF